MKVIIIVIIADGCTKRSNLEMEPKYQMETDVQLNLNILRIKNDKKIL